MWTRQRRLPCQSVAVVPDLIVPQLILESRSQAAPAAETEPTDPPSHRLGHFRTLYFSAPEALEFRA